MPLVTLSKILNNKDKAKAVGAFNVHNLEFINGVVLGAEKANSPVIMMINEAVLKYGKAEVLGRACINRASLSTVDVAVMVDHGADVDFLKKCIDEGIDIMFDGSSLPFEENVEKTKMLADYAHQKGLSIEGEIGALGLSEDGDEEGEAKITSVEEAVKFVSETGVDILAISVGNQHGFYKGEAKINVERISEISKAVGGMPVVMHGGSDIPLETIKASINAGIKKFNIATDLKFAYSQKMKELVAGESMEIQPLKLFPVVSEYLSEIVCGKIKVFNMEN